MSNDTVSDMLTQIRNAIAVKHRFVIVPKTRMTLAITKVLEKEGYILSYEEFNQQLVTDFQTKSKKTTWPRVKILIRHKTVYE